MRHLSILILTLFLLIGSCRFSKIQKDPSLRAKYDAAIAYYQKKDYYKAGVLLEELIPLIVGTKESEIAQFYFAYCSYFQKDLELAAYYFERFYQTFQNSQYTEEARYMHIRSLYESSPPFNLDQSSTTDAIAVTQSFLNAYPNSSFYEECNKLQKELRLKLEKKAFENANLYYKITNYRAAVVTFDNFQKRFPDSDLNEEVAYLKFTAQYRYALQSTTRRKQERLNKALDFYDSFASYYPESKFNRSAQKVYERCIEELKKS